MFFFFFVFKQKTAYEMRISDWSSDVCSSDLLLAQQRIEYRDRGVLLPRNAERERIAPRRLVALALIQRQPIVALRISLGADQIIREPAFSREFLDAIPATLGRSEEHTSELQSLMRISYAVFCLKKKINNQQTTTHRQHELQTLPRTQAPKHSQHSS